ncbi:hypothetical protein M407DRAFT_32506, partial [Tulasnella calospora MUT 4182]
MTSLDRERKRLKERERKAALKATSLARTQQPLTRPRLAGHVQSTSQAGPSYQTLRFASDSRELPMEVDQPHSEPQASTSRAPITAPLPRPPIPASITTIPALRSVPLWGTNSDDLGALPSRAGTLPPLTEQSDDESDEEGDPDYGSYGKDSENDDNTNN